MMSNNLLLLGAGNTITGGGAAAFPTVETTATDTASGGSAATSHAVNLPASLASGDKILLFLGYYGNSVMTTPSGWTLEDSTVTTGAGGQHTGAVLSKTSDGLEGSTVTITFSVSTEFASASYRISGWTSIEVSAAVATSSGTTDPNPPSLSPAGGSDKYMWMAVLTGRNENTTNQVTAFPAGYTSNQTDAEAGPTTAGRNVAVATKELETATDDPAAFTFATAAKSVCYTVAVLGV